LESKSVISIKGEHEYQYRFAKESCNTIPQKSEQNVFDFIAADQFSADVKNTTQKENRSLNENKS
jgi:hypothetical protein